MVWYLLPQQPKLAVRLYNAAVERFGFREGVSFRFQLIPALMCVYVLSIELNDRAVTENVEPIIQKLSQGKFFGEFSDEFGYFCHLPWTKYPRGQPSALLMCAQILGPGGWQTAFHNAKDSSRFDAPTVCGIDYPILGLSKAVNIGEQLHITTYAASSGNSGKMTTFRISNLPNSEALTATCDGCVFKDFVVVDKHSVLVNTTVGDHAFVFRTGYQISKIEGDSFMPLAFDSDL